MAVGQGRFLSRGGDKHTLTLEYLHISIKIIQPTKHIAKGDRNWGMWTFSWQFESGLEAFQGRIKSRCSAGQGCGNWWRQRLGMAELGISAAPLQVWGCCEWGCRWKYVKHLSYWAFSNGLWYLQELWSQGSGEGRMTELLPVLSTGF